jgi:hypothetical protein
MKRVTLNPLAVLKLFQVLYRFIGVDVRKPQTHLIKSLVYRDISFNQNTI